LKDIIAEATAIVILIPTVLTYIGALCMIVYEGLVSYYEADARRMEIVVYGKRATAADRN
jgi:hypothetical protein